jgi:hypothetical protein
MTSYSGGLRLRETLSLLPSVSVRPAC